MSKETTDPRTVALLRRIVATADRLRDELRAYRDLPPAQRPCTTPGDLAELDLHARGLEYNLRLFAECFGPACPELRTEEEIAADNARAVAEWRAAEAAKLPA